MLYPNNIKIEKERRIKIIKEKLKGAGIKIKEIISYIIFDRTNIIKRITVKLHV